MISLLPGSKGEGTEFARGVSGLERSLAPSWHTGVHPGVGVQLRSTHSSVSYRVELSACLATHGYSPRAMGPNWDLFMPSLP